MRGEPTKPVELRPRNQSGRRPGQGKGQVAASAKRIADFDRQNKALELRRAGMTYEAIAKNLGYRGPTGSRKAILTAMRKAIQEPADDVRQLELARLDRMQAGVWAAAITGDAASIVAVLKIMARRALYLGLDAPVKVDITVEWLAEVRRRAVEDGLDPDAAVAEAEMILARSMGQKR